MTMLTVMTMFLIYPFTLSHEHRHHRHHRHAYSEMTLAVYYCSKQKQWYYEKHKIRMTQMTLMALNPGYGIGISPKQRHKRHLRHYRHTRMLPGVWGTPQKCACGWPHAMLAKHVPAQSGEGIKADTHTNSYMLQSESLLIHPKILTRKSESVLIHSAQMNCFLLKKSIRISQDSA